MTATVTRRTFPTIALVLILATAAGPMAATVAHAGGTVAPAPFTREANTDRSGNDIRVETLAEAAGPEACEALCAATPACLAFTYVKKSTTVPKPVCRLKDAIPFGHESSCCTSGLKRQ